MGERAAAWLGPVALGDARLNRRLERVVEDLLDHPEGTIPQACGSWNATLAAYRLLDNAAVQPEAIVAGVAEATVGRCPAGEVVLAVQDTTSVDYSGHGVKAGIGPLEHPSHQGLFVHSTLAVTTQGLPLGLLDQQVWARDPATVGKRAQRHGVPIEGKESAKWLRAVRATQTRVGARGPVVTVADREADIYELFVLVAELQGDWVIRARHDRVVAGEAGSLVRAVQAATVVAEQVVEVAASGSQTARTAQVEVRATQVWVTAPKPREPRAQTRWRLAHPGVEAVGPHAVPEVPLGVVWVHEPRPPDGVAPLQWLLLTSLPTTTAEPVLRVVQFYRYRWLVERFHLVLKSGCGVEELHLEQGERLRRALVIYSVVASWLLQATYQARTTPEAPATELLGPETCQALLAVSYPHQPLSTTPLTIRDAIRLIAKLGGFLGRTHDGEPGVKTIWRGFRRLTDILLTWQLLRQLPGPATS